MLLKHKQDLYEHSIVNECKFWKKKVSIEHVDALRSKVQDLNASRGVIFTGFPTHVDF